MQKGPLGGATPNMDDTNPMGPHIKRMEVENKQLNPQMFGKAGIEYINSGFPTFPIFEFGGIADGGIYQSTAPRVLARST
jgi:hypothetical protein